MSNLFNEIAGNIVNNLGINFDYTKFTRTNNANLHNLNTQNQQNKIEAGSGASKNSSQIAKEVQYRSSGLTFSQTLQNFMENNDLDSEIAIAIASASARYEMDPNLIRAVIRTESSYRPDAVSSAGAMGLMQLMPRTAESLGVTDPFNISQNVHAGTRYLRGLLDRFDGDIELALAAYNAGASNVIRHGGIPPFRETQNFVPLVLERKNNYISVQYNSINGINTSNA